MIIEHDTTQERISQAALTLFLKQGIKRTSVDEIAHAAGLTRVTVYRYFSRREELVLAAFSHIIAPLQCVSKLIDIEPQADIDMVMDSIGEELTHLPHGDLSACLMEFQRVHPAVYEIFIQARRDALKVIFEWVFSVAEGQERLRPGLNRAVVEVYFMEMIVSFLERSTPLLPGLTPSQFFTTLKNLFLYGIITEKHP